MIVLGRGPLPMMAIIPALNLVIILAFWSHEGGPLLSPSRPRAPKPVMLLAITRAPRCLLGSVPREVPEMLHLVQLKLVCSKFVAELLSARRGDLDYVPLTRAILQARYISIYLAVIGSRILAVLALGVLTPSAFGHIPLQWSLSCSPVGRWWGYYCLQGSHSRSGHSLALIAVALCYSLA